MALIGLLFTEFRSRLFLKLCFKVSASFNYWYLGHDNCINTFNTSQVFVPVLWSTWNTGIWSWYARWKQWFHTKRETNIVTKNICTGMCSLIHNIYKLTKKNIWNNLYKNEHLVLEYFNLFLYQKCVWYNLKMNTSYCWHTFDTLWHMQK